MKIWLITSGEPIPLKKERPHRAGILAKILHRNGDKVIWWTTTFDHQKKQYLFNENTEEQSDEGYQRFYLHSKTPYHKNVSLSRIKNHKEVASSFHLEARIKEKPDVIFCSYPTIELAYEAVKYGVDYNIPVIIDVRDLWPNIFISPFHKFLRPFIKIGLLNYARKAKYVFVNSTGITGVSPKYLEFGLNYGNRKRSSKDAVFPLGYDSEGKKEVSLQNLDYSHLNIKEDKFNIWFVGTFGRTYDLSTVITCAKNIELVHPNVNFIFTGDGENMVKWKELAHGCSNIIFTGWVGKNELHYISTIAKVGLMAYSKGAPQGLPNKIYEYMASGLPILSSLEGETKEILKEENIGLSYKANDPIDLANKIDFLLKDTSSLISLGNNSKRVFDEKFDSAVVYKKLVKYLHNIYKDENNP